MAQTNSSAQKPSLGREIGSVAGIFLALFLLLCLVSYSLPAGQATVDGNWGGAVGRFLALQLMGFFGLSAFWLPVLLLVFSLRFFAPASRMERLPWLVAGTTGLLLASCGLAGELPLEVLEVLGHRYPVAGMLGTLLAGQVGRILGRPGSVLFFLALFTIAAMLSLEFSLYSLLGRLRGRLTAVRRRVAGTKEKTPPRPGPSPAKGALVESSEVEAPEAVVPRVHEPVKIEAAQADEEFQLLPAAASGGAYRLPGLGLLDRSEKPELTVDKEYYYRVSKELEHHLANFGVEGKVVGISPGPVITTYEFSPAPGIKITKIVALADDLALGLKAESVRIVGSIPGKAALGIEIPNPQRQIVHIRDILAHERFQKSASRLTIGLGMDVVGNPVVADLAKMPHLLIAGATGSGKSVAVNAIIASILFKASPEEVRLLLIDPKRIELSCYEAIPHLLHPVVVDPKLASRALQWAVREMERRYQLMEEARVKNLASYNEAAEVRMPLIVVIIDELADLMMVSSREVEDAVARLAQMARAAGMHLILATQRPSVDVLTGLIKANFPTRMSFKVSSKVDSRTILDASGAEHLLGAGDMLFMPPGAAKLQRIHGAYISEQETGRIVDFLKEQGRASYDESVLKINEEPEADAAGNGEDFDEKYDEAVALVTETGQASISMLQRRLRVGYNRAARMIEAMEREGVVGPADGSRPREVLVRGHGE